MKYFTISIRKLISSIWSKVTKRSPSRLGKLISFIESLKLKFSKNVFPKIVLEKCYRKISLYSVSRIVPKKVACFCRNNKSGAALKNGRKWIKAFFYTDFFAFLSFIGCSWASNLCSFRTVWGGIYIAAQRASCLKFQIKIKIPYRIYERGHFRVTEENNLPLK